VIHRENFGVNGERGVLDCVGGCKMLFFYVFLPVHLELLGFLKGGIIDGYCYGKVAEED